MSEYGDGLFDQHVAKLRASAVDPEVARERGYVSADTKAQLEREGFGPSQRRPPGLVIPLYDVIGERAGVQLRPDNPRMRDGKPAKYETKAGQKMLLDVPPRVRQHLGNPARPLVVTEGPIKADAIVSAGLDAVALLGVWSWRGTNEDGGKVALTAWENVALNGRQVYVAFDSDAMLKPQVHGAMERLGAFLGSRGAEVAYVYLPGGDAGAKVGADDYLAGGHSANEFLALASPELRRTDTRPAPPPRPKADRRTLAEVDGTFQKWLIDVDLGALHAVLGAVVANRAEGDPVWLLLVAPPSAGKTEILLPLAQLPGVVMSGKLTAPALLSGTAAKDRASDATGGLLRQIGQRGILVNKDFGSVLSMPRDPRAELLQGLRDVYDGRYDRAVGVDGGRTLTWTGHCGLIAGCVPTIDTHHAVVAALGDRYVILRLAEMDAGAQARRALVANGHEEEMRRELEGAVCGLLDHLAVALGDLTAEEVDRLADLATLVVKCRSVVDRDPRTSQIINVPPAEMPARLAKQLGRLLCGIYAIGATDAWPIVVRCGLDSMPANRRAALIFLEGSASEVRTSTVAAAVGLPASTVRRTLEDLEAHGVLDRTEQSVKGDTVTRWAMSEWCRHLWPTSPEMSEQPVPTSPPTPPDEGSIEPCPVSDDFSGEVPGAIGLRSDVVPSASLEADGEAVERWLSCLVGDMSDRGYLVDAGALCCAQDSAHADLEAAAAQLLTHGVENPSEPGQVLQALEDAGCKFDSRFVGRSGKPSTNKAALSHYAKHQPQLGALTTLISAYRDAKHRSDSLQALDEAIVRGRQRRARAAPGGGGPQRRRVHPTINPNSCASGRMSMSEPALMGLDRRLRPLLVADEGHELVRADFDTVEWRVAAALSDDPRLVERIKAGVDLHSALAADLFGPDHSPEQRALAKTLSFGVLYGAGVDGMVKATGLDRREAQRIRTGIWAAYPELEKLAAGLRHREAVQTPYGRTINAPADKDYAFLNHVVQGAARDLLVDALCWLAHDGWGDTIWMLLHDEIILHVPEKDADDAVEALNEAMNLDLLGVPITATAAVLGSRWR